MYIIIIIINVTLIQRKEGEEEGGKETKSLLIFSLIFLNFLLFLIFLWLHSWAVAS